MLEMVYSSNHVILKGLQLSSFHRSELGALCVCMYIHIYKNKIYTYINLPYIFIYTYSIYI